MNIIRYASQNKDAWAVITGSAMGIGKQYGISLAKMGFIGDKNYGDRFRSSPKKVRKKKEKKKRIDLTRLDLGDLSKQGDVFRRQENDYLDRFVAHRTSGTISFRTQSEK